MLTEHFVEYSADLPARRRCRQLNYFQIACLYIGIFAETDLGEKVENVGIVIVKKVWVCIQIVIAVVDGYFQMPNRLVHLAVFLRVRQCLQNAQLEIAVICHLALRQLNILDDYFFENAFLKTIGKHNLVLQNGQEATELQHRVKLAILNMEALDDLHRVIEGWGLLLLLVRGALSLFRGNCFLLLPGNHEIFFEVVVGGEEHVAEQDLCVLFAVQVGLICQLLLVGIVVVIVGLTLCPWGLPNALIVLVQVTQTVLLIGPNKVFVGSWHVHEWLFYLESSEMLRH